jgi:hypothetical protein
MGRCQKLTTLRVASTATDSNKNGKDNPWIPNLALGGTRLDKKDVAVLDDIVLPLGHDLALGLDLGFIAKLLEHLEVVHNGLDKRLLKVRMDDSGRLGRLDPIANGPLANLVGADGEEAAEVHDLAHQGNDLGQRRLHAKLLALLLGFRLRLEASEPLLKADGERNDGVSGSILLDPFRDLGKMLVLFPDVVLLGQVHEVDDGLRREKEQGVDDLHL